jgi:hypothetical protein
MCTHRRTGAHVPLNVQTPVREQREKKPKQSHRSRSMRISPPTTLKNLTKALPLREGSRGSESSQTNKQTRKITEKRRGGGRGTVRITLTVFQSRH